jgi:hypothetical protein
MKALKGVKLIQLALVSLFEGERVQDQSLAIASVKLTNWEERCRRGRQTQVAGLWLWQRIGCEMTFLR